MRFGRRRSGSVGIAGLLLALAGVTGAATPASAWGADDDLVVVANRGSGDISVVDSDSLAVTTYDLPGQAEPMYVNHDGRNGIVLVGDRASSRIVALDDDSFEVVGTVPVGAGVFHQWLDEGRQELWVVGTDDATVSVVDTDSLTVRATFPLPADLVAKGGVPHDVFVSGRNAFVSLVGLPTGGVVVQYSTRTRTETGRIATGGDPHLFVRGGRLFVASQEAGTVSSYVAATLRPLASTAVPAAHGIFVTRRLQVVVTNISGGGTDAVWRLNARLRPVREPVDTSVAVPHNVAVASDGATFVTHSGSTSTALSVLRRGGDRVVTVGTNPFGLAVVD